MRSQFLFICLIAATSFNSCYSKKESKKNTPSPEGYDLNKPVVVKLPTSLDEISGISYYSKDSSVFGIADDKGAIYKIKSGPSLNKWKFSNGADFEDVVRIDSSFYILQSNGDIHKVIFNGEVAQTETYKFELSENNEFEILYADSNDNKLVLICKDCESDNKKKLTTYAFDPANNTFSENSYTIDIQRAAAMANEDKMKFKPSAAAINPVDKCLYIISSINKMLMVCDASGLVKNVYQLDETLFKQPEGITFKPGGDMIVSNESGGTGTATLLFFKYKPSK